ncbi:MAG TPA: glycosyltransferase family 4 protein [Nocardioides sp.]
MSIKNRAKRLIRRKGSAVLGKLPVDRGPAGAQEVTGRARIAEARAAFAGGDPDGAETLLAPLLAADAIPTIRGRALALLAEIHAKGGKQPVALEEARQAIELDPEPETFLVHHRIASVSAPDEARVSLQALIARRPRHRAQAEEIIAALRLSDREVVQEFRRNTVEWDYSGLEHSLDATEAEIDIVDTGIEDDAALRAVVEKWAGELQRPHAALTRGLDRIREWDRLAAWVDANPVEVESDHHRREVALELRRAASRALTAGYTSAAETLVNHSLALRPDDNFARETYLNASDQLAVIRDGWELTERVPLRHETEPRAVLSVLAQSLPIMTGGYATRTHGVMAGLARLGWDMEGITRRGFPYDRWPKKDTREVAEFDEVDGIRYHRVLTDARVYPQYPLRDYIDKYAAEVEKRAREHRASLLHASSFHVNGLATQKAAARLGIPFVYEMRGLEELMKVSRDPRFETSDRYRFTSELENTICHAADRVFVITHALKQLMIERGIPAEKLVVLPNGVHTSKFTPRERDEEFAASLGLTGKTVIGYAGGLVDYEGLDLLLESVALLKARRSTAGEADFHLVVVGDGHFQAKLHAMVDRLELADVVTFTGRVPHEEVASYLSLFDITPFPRLPLPVCEAISPIKPFESMAMGKAVITSSVAALTEIVQDEVTGLVFEKGNAESLAATIERYIESPQLRTEMGARAREWVLAERDWNNVVEIVDATYRELLG